MSNNNNINLNIIAGSGPQINELKKMKFELAKWNIQKQYENILNLTKNKEHTFNEEVRKQALEYLFEKVPENDPDFKCLLNMIMYPVEFCNMLLPKINIKDKKLRDQLCALFVA